MVFGVRVYLSRCHKLLPDGTGEADDSGRQLEGVVESHDNGHPTTRVMTTHNISGKQKLNWWRQTVSNYLLFDPWNSTHIRFII